MEQIVNILKDAGLKNTAPRVSILELVLKAKMPMNAQDIQTGLQNKGMDLVTIYRTLASFETAGIVKRVDLRQDAVCYELSAGHHHHHIVCTNCGDMEDFELCDMESLTKKITNRAQKFKTVSEHSLELFGVCTACAK